MVLNRIVSLLSVIQVQVTTNSIKWMMNFMKRLEGLFWRVKFILLIIISLIILWRQVLGSQAVLSYQGINKEDYRLLEYIHIKAFNLAITQDYTSIKKYWGYFSALHFKWWWFIDLYSRLMIILGQIPNFLKINHNNKNKRCIHNKIVN